MLGRLSALVCVAFAASCTPSGSTPEGSASEAKAEPTRASRGVDVVHAPGGPVAELVAAEQARAKRDKRRLLVYVGATWCEPCEVFMHGIASGKMPPDLSDLRILKFDFDKDEERLDASNYGGRMIPRFVRPGADGLGGSMRFEGSVKGPEAWENILPRLQALFAAP